MGWVVRDDIKHREQPEYDVNGVFAVRGRGEFVANRLNQLRLRTTGCFAPPDIRPPDSVAATAELDCAA